MRQLKDALTRAIYHQLESTIRRLIVTTVQEEINAITAQFKTGIGEVVAKIGELETQVKAGKKPDLTELKKLAQDLDDIVPGTPTTPPADAASTGETSDDVPVVEAPVTVVPATDQ